MNKTISARHNANQQVLITLKSYEAQLSRVPAMPGLILKYARLIDETNTLVAKADSIPSKTAGNKNMARTDLVGICLKTSNILKVYAFTSKNENLNNFIVNSESQLSNQMRHNEILNYAKNLLDQIKPIVPELTIFGLTEELLADLEREVIEFEDLINQPRQLISERKTTNELIEDKIDEIYSLLSNQIDPLIELFNDEKEVYLAYKSARMIVDPASRKKTESAEAIS